MQQIFQKVKSIKLDDISRKGEDTVMLDYRVNTFLSVCQTMNFTKTAMELHITQPAVSNHIRQIENYYNVVLFGYEGKKLYLTKQAQLLQKSLLSLRNNESYIKEQLYLLSNQKKELHFGVTLTIGEYLMAPAIKHYLSLHPTADIRMEVANTKELLHKLEEGQIDFAVIEGNFMKMDYHHFVYRKRPFIAVCSVDNPLGEGSHMLGELLASRIIVRENGSGSREILENGLLERNLNIKDFAACLEIANLNTIKELVEENLGITFLYEDAVKMELQGGKIKRIDVTDFSLSHEMCGVWKKDNLFGAYYESVLRELLEMTKNR